MSEVIECVGDETDWRFVDSAGNQLHQLEIDPETQRLVAHSHVAVHPANVDWIESHDPENGDPCILRGNLVNIDGRKLTVTEPNGTCWIWILSPATYDGREGYFIGRWPD